MAGILISPHKNGTSTEIKAGIKLILIGMRPSIFYDSSHYRKDLNDVLQWTYEGVPRQLASGLIHPNLTIVNSDIYLEKGSQGGLDEKWGS